MEKPIIEQEDHFTLFCYPYQDQIYITVSLNSIQMDLADTVSRIYQKIVRLLQKNGMRIVREQLFGNNGFYQEIKKTRELVFRHEGVDDLPLLSYIHGMPCLDTGFAGLQIQAITNDPGEDQFWTICDREVPVGRGWKRNQVTFLMLQNIQGLSQNDKDSNGKSEQAARMFDYTEEILKGQGLQYLDVVRTWIYLSDILEWYHDFNMVRNAKYSQYGFDINHISRPHHINLPASTGIGGSNPAGAASVMDVLAVYPHSGGHVEIEPIAGSKQTSPFRYGSAFSRGMSIRESTGTIIHTSGTASIDKDGNSVYLNDMRGQVLKTLEVLEALVSREGATLQNICQATVFLKNPNDMDIYQRAMEESGLKKIPAVCVQADVCRDELLFELDAIVAINQT